MVSLLHDKLMATPPPPPPQKKKKKKKIYRFVRKTENHWLVENRTVLINSKPIQNQNGANTIDFIQD